MPTRPLWFNMNHRFLLLHENNSSELWVAPPNDSALTISDPVILWDLWSRIDEELSCLFSSIPGWAVSRRAVAGWPAFLHCAQCAPTTSGSGAADASSRTHGGLPTTLLGTSQAHQHFGITSISGPVQSAEEKTANANFFNSKRLVFCEVL